MTLYFKNPGQAEIISLTTFGVNVKQDESAIGFFGTGFKMAVGGILRLGGRIVVHSGLEKYEFVSRPKTISGKEFGLVHLVMPNGTEHPLSFTTEVGKTWEPWMYYREIRCNMTDEKGDRVRTQLQQAEPGKTLIVVDCIDLEEAHKQAHKYFLDSAPYEELQECNVHLVNEGVPSGTIFYRGIKIGEFKGPCRFIYNLTGAVQLTEDRTIKYPYLVERMINRSLAHCVNEDVIEKILVAPKGFTECDIDWADFSSASTQFLAVAGRLLASRHPDLNPSVRLMLAKLGNTDPYEWVEPTVLQAKMLIRAEKFCAEMGLDPGDTDIRIVAHLGNNTLGEAYGGKIYLSVKVFDMGTKMVCTTLFEEMAHVKMNLLDTSRDMQNFLIDKIGTLYERVTGEPL